jgi:AraC-like DNA-binding protein
MRRRNGIDVFRISGALGGNSLAGLPIMIINRNNERILVIRPGMPEGCCLEELAERCGFRVCQICHELGCSTTHFRNVFVRDTGVSPKRWLDELRLNRTRESLEAGATAWEVALRLGFSCQASLRRALGRYLPDLLMVPDPRENSRIAGSDGRRRYAGAAVPRPPETGSPGACQRAEGS